MADTTIEALRQENEQLRQRIAKLECPDAHAEEVRSMREQLDSLQQSQSLLKGLIDHSPSVIFAKDLQYRILVANQKFAELFRCDPSELNGKSNHELFPPDVADIMQEQDRHVLATRSVISMEDLLPSDGETFVFLTVKFPLYDVAGELSGLGGVAVDITSVKRAEKERSDLQARIIEAQQRTLHEMSTPLLPITEKTVVMPLIGSIDRGRAQQVLETLTQGVVMHSAARAILDITGVTSVNAEVADALVRAAKAARLLGAEVVLTGISPSLAQQLVELGIDLTGIDTCGTLQAGIARALSSPSARPYDQVPSRSTHRGGGM